MKLTIEVYKDIDRQWRWRFLRRAFGKTYIVADSAEGYHNRKDCTCALHAILRTIAAGKQQIVVTV